MITAKHAGDAWKMAIEHVMLQGSQFQDEHQRLCYEVCNLTITVEHMEHITFPISCLQQIKDWMYPSLHEIAEVALGKKASSFYGYVYGQRIFKFQGHLNQLQQYVIPLLQKNKGSRRCVVSVLDPVVDTALDNTYVPGIIALDFYVRQDALHVTAFIRSNDIFIGWPANMYQIYVVLEYVAQRLDIPIGSITTMSVNAHLFEEYKQHIASILKV
ncbi:MAG: thymidylate synthase [Candidatus Woesearchaeota archaeon]